MNKYEILEEKLNNVKKCIAKVKVSNRATKKHLIKYEDYVNKLIVACCERKINNSQGALLGLIQGISDYDELCANDALWRAVYEADNYYSKECSTFES